MTIKIGLLGSIPKGDMARASFEDWTIAYEALLQDQLPEAQILRGDAISDNVGPEMVVGHDLWFVREADIIIVNAPAKLGAGTAQEMVFAKYFGKPVISVIPPNTHHRRTNVVFDGMLMDEWVHPFLLLTSDFVAVSPGEAVDWVKAYVADGMPAPKGMEYFDELIRQFENKFPELVERYRKAGTTGERTKQSKGIMQ